MKHTDLSIVFLLIFVCLVIEFDFKMNTLRKIQNQGVLYNNIFDTAVNDSLRNGLELINTTVSINEELVIQQFFEGLNHLMSIDNTSFPVIMITNKEGFTIWDNGVKRECVYGSFTRESKVALIQSQVEKALNSSSTAKYNNLTYRISIPYIDFNEWYNTISDMGLFIIFQGNTFQNNKLYNRFIISGASYKYMDIESE